MRKGRISETPTKANGYAAQSQTQGREAEPIITRPPAQNQQERKNYKNGKHGRKKHCFARGDGKDSQSIKSHERRAAKAAIPYSALHVVNKTEEE